MSPNDIPSSRITFTEEGNAIDYLEKTYCFLESTKQSPQNWKWVVLALHGALYGFAICTLSGIHHDHIYRKRKCRLQKRSLMTLDEAIRKCQDPTIMGAVIDSRPLQLTGAQQNSIKEISKIFRNNFAHYIPKTWIISVDHFPHMVSDVLDVISFLVIDCKTNIHILQRHEEIERLVNNCKAILGK